MKRSARITAFLLVLAAALLTVFSGCAIERPEKPPSRPDRAVIPDSSDLTQDIVRYPLTIARRALSRGSCVINYPYVCNDNMYLLNLSIRSAFADFAEECEADNGSVDFKVVFNRYGLLSVKLSYSTPDGVVVNTSAVNFDSDSGRLVDLKDCFGSTGADYLSMLGDSVAGFVEQNGLTVIGEIPPVTDETDFIFTFEGLSLLYREYEIVTPDSDPPVIRIRYKTIKDFVAKDGLLNRMA